MARELEIRKLQPKYFSKLVQILEFGEGWRKLIGVIPKSIAQQPFEAKYTFEHVRMIEQAGTKQKRPCSAILLEEWGTSGKKRPTLLVLLELLRKAELFWAANYVSVFLLKEVEPQGPETDVFTDIDIADESIQKILKLRAEKSHLILEEDISKLGEVNSFEKQILMNFSDAKHFMNEKIQKVVVPEKQLEERIDVDLNVNKMEKSPLGVAVPESGPNKQLDCIQVVEVPPSREDTDNVEAPNISLHLNTALPHFSYSELEQYIANFCEEPLPKGHQISKGCELGTGAFGSVYLGVNLSKNYVAVKKLKRDVINIEKQFKNEVEALSRYQHSHLLPLLGYSCDGPAYCLVYEFMCNGSLQERLACQGSTPVLPWGTRLKIALGTSEGILYLHTAFEKPLIHRDIKSANILLDQDFVPKVGDFGLVRLGSSGQQSCSTALTSTVFGTSAYMAPEAFRGDISVKLDTFSFGVVMLELLTSLPPYDKEREGHDLMTHVEDICVGSIEPLLDTKAGDWGKTDELKPAETLYSLALVCLKEKRERPNMDFVVKNIKDNITSCLLN